MTDEMSDEELVEVSQFLLGVSGHAKTLALCREIVRRGEAGTLPKRNRQLKHREYMREYMRKRRAAKKAQAWREELYADGKVPDRRAIEDAANEARKGIAVIEEDRNPFEDL
jgi:hypothetical protein